MEKDNLPDCCKPKKEYKGDNPFMGILYGLIPHVGCILFIIAAVLGTTVLMQFFKPLLLNRNIFYYLILISVVFATLSAYIYLRKNKLMSKAGIKKKKKYLTTMYGSTVGINILLIFLVFPFLASATGGVTEAEAIGSDILKISVDIPCPGHAPLITNELSTIEGVKGSEYSFPNDFEVYFDSSITSQEEILSLGVFEEYPATVLEEATTQGGVQEVQPKANSQSAGSCSGGCGGTEDCGGSCGSPSCNYNK
jgi:hypothetical protein